MKMKKLRYFGMILCSLAAVYSCGLLDDPENNNNQDPDENDPSEAEVLQGKVDETAKELMDELDLSNWNNAMDFADRFGNYLGDMTEREDDSLDAFSDWLDDMGDAMTQTSGSTTKTVIALSALKGGTFEEVKGKLTYKSNNQNELRIIVYPSGKASSAVVTYGPDGNEYEIKDEDATRDKDDDPVFVKIPQWIQIQMLDGNTTRISIRLDPTVTDTNKDKVLDIDVDRIGAKATITVEDYSLEIDEIGLDGTSKATVSYVLKRGQKTLIDFSLSGKRDSQGDLRNSDINADFLGKIQIKGTMDVAKFEEYSDACDDNATNESVFKSNLSKLNGTIDLTMYCTGLKKGQAKVKFEAFKEDGGMEWYALPVFNYSDGTSQSWAEFSDNEQIRSLSDKFTKWLDKISARLDKALGVD